MDEIIGAGEALDATVAVEETPDAAAPAVSEEDQRRRRADYQALEQNVANAQKKVAKMQGHLDDATAGLAAAEAELAAATKPEGV